MQQLSGGVLPLSRSGMLVCFVLVVLAVLFVLSWAASFFVCVGCFVF